MQNDQLASTSLIETRGENGENHHCPLPGGSESAEMEAIRKETETRSAVYSALEGKDWTGVEALHRDTQTQTGMTLVAFTKWLDDHHVEYDIEMRTSGQSLEFKSPGAKSIVPTQDEVIIDKDALKSDPYELADKDIRSKRTRRRIR